MQMKMLKKSKKLIFVSHSQNLQHEIDAPFAKGFRMIG